MQRVPQNGREARVWNYFNKDETGFWPLRDWPYWAKDVMLSAHRTNRERFNLFFFLWVNGLPPERGMLWTLCSDVVTRDGESHIITEGYDESAHRQARQMIQQAVDDRDGVKPWLYAPKKMMDMTSGHVRVFAP